MTPMILKALRGLVRMAQAGTPGHKRQHTNYLGFLFLGVVLLMLATCTGSQGASGAAVDLAKANIDLQLANDQKVSAQQSLDELLGKSKPNRWAIDKAEGRLSDAQEKAAKATAKVAEAQAVLDDARRPDPLRAAGDTAFALSKIAIKGLIFVACLLGIWRAIQGPRRIPVDPITGVVDSLDTKTADAAGLRTVTTRQEVTINQSLRKLPEGATHIQEQYAPPVPPPPLPPRPIVAPVLAELREAKVFRPELVYLGESAQGPVTRTWKRDGSGFIAALQGGGKSNLMALAAIQMLEAGGIVIVFDAHSHKPESLVNYLGPLADERVLGAPIYGDYQSVREGLRYHTADLHRIIEAGGTARPRLYLVDEGNGTAKDSRTQQPFVEFMGLIAQQSRGFDCSGLVAVQSPLVREMGGEKVGSAIRDCLGWSVCGRIPPRMAGFALRLTGSDVKAPSDTGVLDPGEMYVLDGEGQPLRVKVPHVKPADLQAVAAARLAQEHVSGVQVLNGHGPALTGHTPEALVTTQPQAVLTAERLQLVEDVDLREGDPGYPRAEYRRLHMEEKLGNRRVLEACWGEGIGGRKYSRELANLREATKDCTCNSDLHKEN
jgi:hypothetical protein